MSLIQTITLALQAYILWVQTGAERELDTLEDEIYDCIDDGSPSAKLRVKRLEARRQRKLRAVIALRPPDNPPEARPDIPV